MISATNLPGQRKAAPQDSNPEAAMAETVRSKLAETGYHCLKGLTCRYHEGILTLHGSVPSFYMKQVAQTVANSMDAVSQVVNRIEVQVDRSSRHDL